MKSRSSVKKERNNVNNGKQFTNIVPKLLQIGKVQM